MRILLNTRVVANGLLLQIIFEPKLVFHGKFSCRRSSLSPKSSKYYSVCVCVFCSHYPNGWVIAIPFSAVIKQQLPINGWLLELIFQQELNKCVWYTFSSAFTKLGTYCWGGGRGVINLQVRQISMEKYKSIATKRISHTAIQCSKASY